MDEIVWERCRCGEHIIAAKALNTRAEVVNRRGNLMDPNDKEAYLHSKQVCIKRGG